LSIGSISTKINEALFGAFRRSSARFAAAGAAHGYNNLLQIAYITEVSITPCNTHNVNILDGNEVFDSSEFNKLELYSIFSETKLSSSSNATTRFVAARIRKKFAKKKYTQSDC
jgi:hypothetical protein